LLKVAYKCPIVTFEPQAESLILKPLMQTTCALCNKYCVMALQAHFDRGLSIGTEDFSIDDFDPCRK